MTNVGMENIDELVGVYRGARFIATGASTRWGRLEVGILGLSVVTTGSLWTAISDVQPDETLWIGAVLATVTAFLSGYMKYTNQQELPNY